MRIPMGRLFESMDGESTTPLAVYGDARPDTDLPVHRFPRSKDLDGVYLIDVLAIVDTTDRNSQTNVTTALKKIKAR